MAWEKKSGSYDSIDELINKIDLSHEPPPKMGQIAARREIQLSRRAVKQGNKMKNQMKIEVAKSRDEMI